MYRLPPAAIRPFLRAAGADTHIGPPSRSPKRSRGFLRPENFHNMKHPRFGILRPNGGVFMYDIIIIGGGPAGLFPTQFPLRGGPFDFDLSRGGNESRPRSAPLGARAAARGRQANRPGV
ncbi:hypothetical protein CE91St41_05520 [Oscillospiraceae bacterium]|nr:hypothetical protein CE91St40_05520 [Oscillospiraceae bacterium]BDF73663.1 hypothetical protein CE91St41_05520 [Oscillospiraceae bacterium]